MKIIIIVVFLCLELFLSQLQFEQQFSWLRIEYLSYIDSTNVRYSLSTLIVSKWPST